MVNLSIFLPTEPVLKKGKLTLFYLICQRWKARSLQRECFGDAVNGNKIL